MMHSFKLLGQSCAVAVLMAVGMGAAQAAAVTYNYTISGTVIIGDETYGSNVWDLTAGDVITATGTFTADLGTIGNETGTVSFAGGSGNTMLIDLLGGQSLTDADDTSGGGASLTFSVGSLTDFDFLSSDFSSYFLSFDDATSSSVYGEWDTVQLTAVPVPAAVWLFGSGLAMLGWVRRRPVA